MHVPSTRGAVVRTGGAGSRSCASRHADLVTFEAPSGGVVWLGRTEAGDVASIVVTSGMPGARA